MYRSSWNHVLRSVGAQRPSVRCELVRFTIVDDPSKRPQCQDDQANDAASPDEGSASSDSDDSDSSDCSARRSDSYGSGESASDEDDKSGESQEDGALSGGDSDADSESAAETQDEDYSDEDYDWVTTISDKQGLLNILAFSAEQWKRGV